MTSEREHKPDGHAVRSEADAEILSMKFGGKTIAENLDAAIAAGDVVCGPDGKLSLPQTPTTAQLSNDKPLGRDCSFLNHFMFKKSMAKLAFPSVAPPVTRSRLSRKRCVN
jgi:hypothetical protein